jgi:hypothetical protein
MSCDLWIKWADVIRAQHELQVKLSLERHHAFMLQHGLASCENVMDIGTGDGLFLEKLPKCIPRSSFEA